MSSTEDFGRDLGKMVPGFDFLQGLLKNASSSLPPVGQWVAPTLNPEELGKRIQELKTVQFWLEQNAKILGGTIQAMEVQRMTLSTLQSLNMPLADLAQALKIQTSQRNRPELAEAKPAAGESQDESPASAAAVDPMQWWSALTQQFGQLASQSVQAAKDLTEVGVAPDKKSPKAATKKAGSAAKGRAGAAVKRARPRVVNKSK